MDGQENKVTLVPNEQVTGFEKEGNRIKRVKTNKAVYDADVGNNCHRIVEQGDSGFIRP